MGSCVAFGPRGLQCVHAIPQDGLSIGDSWPFRLASKGSDMRARLCGVRIARPGSYISMEAVSSEQEGRARRYRARFRAEVASRGLTEISALLHSRKFAYNTCIAGASYMHADRSRYIIQPGYCSRPTDCCSSSKSLISACVARRIHAQLSDARSRRIGMMASFSLPPSLFHHLLHSSPGVQALFLAQSIDALGMRTASSANPLLPLMLVQSRDLPSCASSVPTRKESLSTPASTHDGAIEPPRPQHHPPQPST